MFLFHGSISVILICGRDEPLRLRFREGKQVLGDLPCQPSQVGAAEIMSLLVDVPKERDESKLQFDGEKITKNIYYCLRSLQNSLITTFNRY